MKEINRDSVDSAAFLGRSTREDYLSYMAHDKHKALMGPGGYHKTVRPFLKKSFNASLPPARFV